MCRLERWLYFLKRRWSLFILYAAILCILFFVKCYCRENFLTIVQEGYAVLYIFFLLPSVQFWLGACIFYLVASLITQKNRKILYSICFSLGVAALLCICLSPMLVQKTEITFEVFLAKYPLIYTLFGSLFGVGTNGLLRNRERRIK